MSYTKPYTSISEAEMYMTMLLDLLEASQHYVQISTPQDTIHA